MNYLSDNGANSWGKERIETDYMTWTKLSLRKLLYIIKTCFTDVVMH